MTPALVREQFVRRFHMQPQAIAVAPGRVNLIGEHTDYNDGFVFPAAIDRGLWIAFGASHEKHTIVSSQQRGDGVPYDARTVEPGDLKGWATYTAGMAWSMRDLGSLSNLNALVNSDIPIGSGVSSSAALEMAFGVAWRHVDALEVSGPDLAKRGQRCENEFVGVNSGIMDQMASAMGRAGHAMFLDTRTLTIEYAPVPSDLAIVLCDTLTPRSLAGSEYNVRRAQCEAACVAMGVAKLRDADLEMLEAHRGHLEEVVYRRARHVINENDRCLAFKKALEASSRDQIGQLMRDSHESLRHDYEVSCYELDVMAEAAWKSLGCIGARMTGAGFGGACVALVEADRTDEFVASALEKFERKLGRAGEAMVCQVADGARIL